MKRTIIAGLYTLLAGAFTLLLVASILFSCRSGEDPHNTRSSASVEVESVRDLDPEAGTVDESAAVHPASVHDLTPFVRDRL